MTYNLKKDQYLQRQWELDLRNQEVPDLDWVVEWIKNHLTPEAVFNQDELVDWARDHNMEFIGD